MDLPLLHFIQFLQKKSAISYLQTCNINLAFLSLVYSSTNKGKTGKSNTSVVHGLHTSQLVLLCPTEIWFESVGSFIALNSQSNTIGLRKNQPVWCSWYVLDAMFFTRGHKLFSLITSFPQLLFSATPILVSQVTRAVLCLHGCIFFESQNTQHAYLLHVRKMQNVCFIWAILGQITECDFQKVWKCCAFTLMKFK